MASQRKKNHNCITYLICWDWSKTFKDCMNVVFASIGHFFIWWHDFSIQIQVHAYCNGADVALIVRVFVHNIGLAEKENTSITTQQIFIARLGAKYLWFFATFKQRHQLLGCRLRVPLLINSQRNQCLTNYLKNSHKTS